ncbi:DEAD/DEAH box helicase [Christensenella timonensis]|uniref:DEAD/DEAH box helicase n=1 Tax=Christensenella timonensis TaxID=1816678 RepID=UPI000837657C|nr:DEAD/DEAH box helicase [Christensenella timonensis]
MSFSQQLSKEMNRTLQKAGYLKPTPIQEETLPALLEKKDLIGLAQTGTGKTAAFMIPILENIFPPNKKVQALILCPTRELAMQTAKVAGELSRHIHGLRTVSVYGGQPANIQIRALRTGAQIVVGTPGRIKDLIGKRVLKLKNVRTVVLDEADEMLDFGFREDMKEILSCVPDNRQTMLFSATMNKEVTAIARQFQSDPVRVEIGMQNRPVETVAQAYMQTKRKSNAVCGLIRQCEPRLSLVFCNTKRKVKELQKELHGRGLASACLHGDMRQKERDTIMNTFRKGKTKVLIATDVAARGIDINNIDLVINYDVPDKPDYYVHRIGRTGRAGKDGRAYTLITPREHGKIRDLERKLHIKLRQESREPDAQVVS